MKQIWSRISAWVDGRNLRERAMRFVAITAVLVWFVNALVLGRMTDQESGLARQMHDDSAATTSLQKEIAKLAASILADPNDVARARLKTLNAELAASEDDLKNVQKGLVGPERMLVVVDDLLRKRASLKLVSMNKLPVLSMSATGEQNAQPATPGVNPATNDSVPVIYKHGVRVVVQGSYAELSGYLAALEKMPEQIIWGKVLLHVEEYPVATLEITVFTLSLERKWLNI
jgi:MSHA biogenesis protein MshJ